MGYGLRWDARQRQAAAVHPLPVGLRRSGTPKLGSEEPRHSCEGRPDLRYRTGGNDGAARSACSADASRNAAAPSAGHTASRSQHATEYCACSICGAGSVCGSGSARSRAAGSARPGGHTRGAVFGNARGVASGGASNCAAPAPALEPFRHGYSHFGVPPVSRFLGPGMTARPVANPASDAASQTPSPADTRAQTPPSSRPDTSRLER